jgi:ribosomal protein L7/L12
LFDDKNLQGGKRILNIKAWKLWLFAAACFLFAGIMNLIEKKYLTGIIDIFLSVADTFLSISNYKKDNKPNKIEVHEAELKEMNIELKQLIAEDKKYKAIEKYRNVTGLGLKEAKEYVDSMSKENLH